MAIYSVEDFQKNPKLLMQLIESHNKKDKRIEDLETEIEKLNYTLKNRERRASFGLFIAWHAIATSFYFLISLFFISPILSSAGIIIAIIGLFSLFWSGRLMFNDNFFPS